MRITKANYFKPNATKMYMGASQFKDFMKCPAYALAKINGDWEQEQSDSLLQGSFLDAYFENSMDKFKEEHPEMFKRDGTLKKEFEKVNDIIGVIEADPIMSKLCKGKQQKIFKGEIAGVPFKIMIDSLHPDKIVDRKCMRDFKDIWKDGGYVAWWDAWGYDIQAAIYQEIYYQNTGKRLPFELVAISKESVPDKAWIRFSQNRLDEVLDMVKAFAPKFQAMKEGLIDAPKCGECDYCRSIKMLSKPDEV